MQKIASLIIPGVLFICAGMLLFSKKNLYESFICGAEAGLKTSVSLLPGLVLMCTAASLFFASGASEIVSRLLCPITDRLGIPSGILPFLAVRPISGSASNSVLAELYKNVGADSLEGFTASVIAGSSDTMFYIFSVYFSAAKVKNGRYAVIAGTVTMLAVIITACAVSRIFF